jgi:hypothetical protein
MHVLGTVNSYSDLHTIMRARAEALEISREQIDYISGLQSGYSSKVLAPVPSKRLGPLTMTLMLPALGMKLVAVEDAEALAQIGTRMVRRQSKHAVHAKAVEYKLSRRFLRRIARKGGANSRRYMTRQRATELARHANAIRWAAVKAAVQSKHA